jgi:hypothetical protein
MGVSVRTATGAGLTVLLLAGGAVGCSKGEAEQSPDMTPAAAVAKAAKKSEDITSLRYRMTGRVPEQGRVTAEASISMKPPAMSMKISALDGPGKGAVELRLADGALYMGAGEDGAKEMDGKHWIKFGPSGRDRTKGGLTLNSSRLRNQVEKNPAQESTFLTGSKDVKKVGSETVDGVRTTHYAGTVGLDELRASLKGKDQAVREAREKSLKQYEAMGIDKLAMDLWVGADDHTKRFRVRGDAAKGPLDLTMIFLDYNKPVTVTAPAAKDTVDLGRIQETGAS